jgi:hypothetical protein
MSAEKSDTTGRPHVFVSYSYADREVAQRIAERLRGSNLRVWFPEWELTAGDSIADRVREAINSSDVLLVLLSPSSVASKWVHLELNTFLAGEIDKRAITVVPALLADCEIPVELASRMYLDFRSDFEAGINKLIQQLSVISEIDFSRLKPDDFERLVVDLLRALDFVAELTQQPTDRGVDIVATHRNTDPFGVSLEERWLVQVKLYQDRRVDIATLRQIRGAMEASGLRFDKALMVTSFQLTSVAKDYLVQDSPAGSRIRVIEGPELRRLLTVHSDIARKYFGGGSAQ